MGKKKDSSKDHIPSNYDRVRKLDDLNLTEEEAHGIRDDLLNERLPVVSLREATEEVISELEEHERYVCLTMTAQKQLKRYLLDYWLDTPHKTEREARRI